MASSKFQRAFTPFYEAIRADFSVFLRALKLEPTWQQQQFVDWAMAAEYGRAPLRAAFKSGQGPGKTTMTGAYALWRCLRNVNAMTILTAPTMRQVQEVWLAEVRRTLERADPMLQRFITVTKTKVQIGDPSRHPDWGVKTVTATKEENAQGFHEKNMTIIGDEASGIPRKIIDQFKGTASNPNCVLLLTGNPNTRDCAFFDCFHSQRHLWHCVTWNAEETPETEWFSKRRNEEIAEEYGRDSDVYRVRVLGEFPHVDPNSVMSSEDVERCMDKALMLRLSLTPRAAQFGGGLARQFGLDFARYGGDENTLFRRQGMAIVDWGFWPHTDPSEIVAMAFRKQIEAHWKDEQTIYVADAGGLGQGVMSRFHEAGKRVLEFHSAGVALERDYANKMTEAWFHLGRIVRAGGCYLPKDSQLLQQLSNRRYFTDSKGRLILEKKDDYMKRGYPSPDRADGAVMAFYDQVVATGRAEAAHRQQEQAGGRVFNR